MRNDDLANKIRAIVQRYAVFNAQQVTNETDLSKEHGIDSIKMVQLIVDLEEAFDIEVDSASLNYENFANSGAITRYVQKKLA